MKQWGLIKVAVVLGVITMAGTAFAWNGNGMSGTEMGRYHYSQSCTQNGGGGHHNMNHGWSNGGHHYWGNDDNR